MILLDTSRVSEPLSPAPDARVIAWIGAQPLETLFLSAISVAEPRAGVAQLPAGKRSTGLQQNLEKRVLPLFAGRVLAFDLAWPHCQAVGFCAGRQRRITGALRSRQRQRHSATHSTKPHTTAALKARAEGGRPGRVGFGMVARQ